MLQWTWAKRPRRWSLRERGAELSGSDEYSRLRVFPVNDAAFSAVVMTMFEREGGASRANPADLQRALRETYPLAHVQVQDWLGMNGNIRPYWYVFRDGRLVASPKTP